MEKPADKMRRRVGYVILFLLVVGTVYMFSPGIPVLIGPWAWASDIEAGEELFQHEWQPNDALAHGDGLGPVFNGKSCVACHFQGGVGGGGGNQNNVTTFEVHPTKGRPEVVTGLVHHLAIDDSFMENSETLKTLYPIIKGFTETTIDPKSGCRYVKTIPDFNPVTTDTINSTALFGAGWIDRISSKAITRKVWGDLIANTAKEFHLDFSAMPAGRARRLPDGRIGKFGWKAQFASLEEFVAAACANELGLGNPVMDQAAPLHKPDYDCGAQDLDRSQFKALHAFVDTLPRPVEILPEDGHEREQAERGKVLFTSVGCALCHTPDVGGVKGVYSDFLLHTITDRRDPNSYAKAESEAPIELPTNHPRHSEWKTPPLWGVADSAPYFHDGGSPTLEGAISRHGGDGERVTKAFQKLPVADQKAIVLFLKTLKAPPEAIPADGMAEPDGRVAQR